MHPIQIKILNISQTKSLGPLTLRKIGELVGETHPEKIRHHLTQLEKKNLIKYNKDNKIIELLTESSPSSPGLITLPVMGAANCGEALSFADDQVRDYIQVSPNLINRNSDNIITLEASGDSMNRCNINGKTIENGDYVIVDNKYKNPDNGDYVVSIIDGMANIKKFFKDEENQQIVLISESVKNYPPIFIGMDEIENYSICGKVIQVIKKPKY